MSLYFLFINKPLVAFLLPFFLINLFLYLYLIGSPLRLLNFFLAILPVSILGLFPVFYREIFLYFIPIFGIFFLGTTQFINKVNFKLNFTLPVSKYVILLLCALLVSFINVCIRGWFTIKLLRHYYMFLQSLVLFIVVMSSLKDRENLFRAVNILFFGCVIAALIFIIISFSQGMVFARRIKVPFAEFSLNEIAIFVDPYIPIGISLIWISYQMRKKIAILLSIIIIVIALIITQSRGAWIAVFCSTLYLFVKRRFYSGIFILLLLILILFSFEMFRQILTIRLQQIGGSDISLLERFLLWKTSLEVIKQNFLFGVGVNNFRAIKFYYGFPYLLDPAKVHHAHSIYLDILANLGILGFFGFFGLIKTTLSRLSEIINKKSNGKVALLSLGLKGSLITFLAHGIIDCGLFRNVTMFSVMVILGISWAIIKINKDG
jgi:O-antigen ligase